MLTIYSNNLVEIQLVGNEKKENIQRKINIKINTSILNRKIIQNSQLQDVDRNKYFDIIQGVSETNDNYSCYISIEAEAFYNYWSKKFFIKNEEKIYKMVGKNDQQDNNDQQNNNEKIILNFVFHLNIIPFNYKSGEQRNKYNYLECSSSSKLILRKKNEEYQIAIPLQFNIPTEQRKYVTDQIKLIRSLNQIEIPIKITWKLIQQQNETKIQLKIQFPNGISNYEISAVLYSRIVIKESSVSIPGGNFDFAAQTHKKLSEIKRKIENYQKKVYLDLFIEERCSPLFFGERIKSHHIVILTINFKITNIYDLFKTNKFQIEIPVDLYPDRQINEDGTENKIEENFDKENLYNQYFDQITLLNKPYRDYQTYI